MSGIYSITNIINGHQYIGSATRLRKREGRHRRLLRSGDHHSRHLQCAYQLYGPDAFRFDVLEECEIDRLIEREQWWMDMLRPAYNVSPRAGSTLGIRASAEIRARLSASHRGKKLSAEQCAKMSARMMGNTYTKGKKLSAKHRAKITASLMGHEISDETRAKISAARVGVVFSAEHRARISANQTGRKLSTEVRARISSSVKETLSIKSGRIAWG